MKNFYKLALALCFAIGVSAHPTFKPQKTVESQLQSLTLEQKIGQLLMPSVKPSQLNEDGQLSEEAREQIEKYKVGGFHLLIDAQRLQSPYKAALYISSLQKLSALPLFIAADLEGGAGFYYEGVTRLPRAMALSATGDRALAYAAGRITALEARRIGINVNFAPDLDVNSNPANPIINIRSYGSEPKQVIEMGIPYLQGLQKTGMLAVAKHFPGHGDTAIDSHLSLPTLNLSRETLQKRELVPFQAAVKAGTDGIMVGHIALPQIDPSGTPASLSAKVTGDILRRELGFKGLVFTDALNMNSIAENYSAGQAAVMAIKAGADVLVCLADVKASFEAIKAAVGKGEIGEERLNDSVRRILAYKEKLGLTFQNETLAKFWEHDFEDQNHRALAERMNEKAITLLRNNANLLPLKTASQKVLSLSILDKQDGWRETRPGETFEAGLESKFKELTTGRITDRTEEPNVNELLQLAKEADLIFVNIYVKVAAYKGNVQLSQGQETFLKELAKLKKPQVFVFYGNPYLCSSLQQAQTVVLAYECTQAAEEAVLKALFGQNPILGKLPVKLQEPKELN